MLYAYFDEMGTHSQSRTISITGFVASLDLWSDLAVDWRLILSVSEVPYFRASECDAGDGIYSGMDRSLREALSGALTKLIAQHHPMGIYVGILRAEWDNFKDGPIGSRFLTPYHLCFEFCMQRISKWSRSDANGESVALIFAEQREYESNAELLYDFYRGKSQWGNELVSLAFAPADAVPALQAADLLSYEMNRYVAAKKRNPNTPLRPSMQIMYDANIQVIGGQYDAEALGGILREQPW